MDKPHSLVVAGPGLGLVNGSTALAKSLASAGFAVTLVCFARSYHTHANTKRLQPLDPAIRLEIVPDGLDLDAQNYMDLFLITDAMQEGLEKLVEKLGDERHPVTCIISDTFMAWTQHVANKFGIHRIDFFTSNATSYLLVLAFPELIARGYLAPQKGDRESPLFIDCVKGRPRFPLDELDREMFVDDPHNHILQGLAKSAALAKEAERVLIHSVSELESSAFESLYREYGIKACAIGPLMHERPAHQQYQGPPAACLSWLDGQGSSSVIYVSFGSNAALSRDEFVELAHGLEASGQAFLWVVRSDATTAGGLLSDILPAGFLTRTQNRGLIVPWAPQLAVLAHPAVGGFLTHCGWNSTLESLWNGVPMLGCPRGAEQKTNARFIAEAWRVGIELERTDMGGFHRREVEKSVKALMIDGQARTRVQGLKEIVRKAASNGGASHSNLVEFANDMRTLLHQRL